MSGHFLKIFVAFATLITTNMWSVTQTKEGWDYNYDVKNKGTRSEYVVGKLKFKGRDLAAKWGNVITSLGEFKFVEKLAWADMAPEWVPMRPYEGSYIPTFQESIVENLLSGSDASYRRVNIKSNLGKESGKLYIEGNYEEVPSNIGREWFYSITRGCWVNPARMEEAEKAFSTK